MLQLGYFEALGGWEEINEGPKRLQEVTPEDIQRVAQEYLIPERSSVAIYYRSEDAEPVDEELAGLDPRMQGMVKQAIADINQTTDPSQIMAGLQQMQTQLAQAPAQFQPAIKYLIKKMEERLAELEAGE